MQAQLTAGTQGDSLMTPHFVAALEQATGGRGGGAGPDAQGRAAMDALGMTKAPAHILPAALRQRFALSTTKRALGATSTTRCAGRGRKPGEAMGHLEGGTD